MIKASEVRERQSGSPSSIARRILEVVLGHFDTNTPQGENLLISYKSKYSECPLLYIVGDSCADSIEGVAHLIKSENYLEVVKEIKAQAEELEYKVYINSCGWRIHNGWFNILIEW
jgi:hypothetical protein